MPSTAGTSGGVGRDDPAAHATDVGPSAAIAGLDEGEVSVLREVGRQWEEAARGSSERLRDLPVDPSLHRFPPSLQAIGAGRFADIDFVETDRPTEIRATAHADVLRRVRTLSSLLR